MFKQLLLTVERGAGVGEEGLLWVREGCYGSERVVTSKRGILYER